MGADAASWRHKIHEESGAGLTIEIWEFARKAHRPLGPEIWDSAGTGNAAIRIVHAAAIPVVRRQLCLRLNGGSTLLEPGAFQYSKGRITAEMQKNANAGGWIARRITAAATGESAYATRFSGTGEVWTEPSEKYFVAATMDGPGDALLLDDKAFYACESSIEVSTHTHSSVQGLLSGNGLMQPKLSGRGVFVMESPVPQSEIEVIELDGRDELTVDGDLMLAFSASLQVTLKPLVRGIRNAMRSGEGLVYTLSGKGIVFLMPTRSLGH